MVLSALETYGYSPTRTWSTFTKHRRRTTVYLDAYTADIRACRSSHVLTGLPTHDAVNNATTGGSLYGVDRLIAVKKQEKASLDAEPSTDIRDREDLSSRSGPSTS
jgi:formate C-acetyltransferase